MGEIVKIDESIDQVKLNKAEEAHKEILARTYIVAGNLLELGKLFKTMRDEKLYELLGASTFTEYCGYPEIHYARPTIYSFIGIYELYVLKLNYHPKTLLGVGHRNLQIIKPIMKDEERSKMELGEWIEKGTVLSESDLINEVREAQNKPPMLPRPKEEGDVDLFSFNSYLEFVKAHPCIICRELGVDAHHFPKTKGAGEPNTHRIPLCREHHAEYHDDPFNFKIIYEGKIFKYFYNTFLKCFSLIRKLKDIEPNNEKI